MNARPYPPLAVTQQRLPAPSVALSDGDTYAAAVLHLLSEAARTCTSLEDARVRLERGRVSRKLIKLAGGVHAGRERCRDAMPPPHQAVTAYEMVIYAHLATVLCRRSLARVFLRGAAQEPIGAGQGFWREYARGLDAVMTGRPFEPRELNTCCSLEQYWLGYLDLMEVITHRGDIARALERIDHAFKARNADPHISQDWFVIEGSARARVRWDFRRDAILLACQQQSAWPATRLTIMDQ